jgi:hypothetical protein
MQLRASRMAAMMLVTDAILSLHTTALGLLNAMSTCRHAYLEKRYQGTGTTANVNHP